MLIVCSCKQQPLSLAIPTKKHCW